MKLILCSMAVLFAALASVSLVSLFLSIQIPPIIIGKPVSVSTNIFNSLALLSCASLLLRAAISNSKL